uniref:(northern house mosquito) hypothetical protein n=1 Tax=Culex pipiens TaxID=7175 RepID=A0A8D8GQK0_CULPI
MEQLLRENVKLVYNRSGRRTVDGLMDEHSDAFTLPGNFAPDGDEKQHKEQIVHVPDEVQHAHVEQLVPIDERPEQSKRADDTDDEAQSHAERYLHREAVINQLDHVVQLVVQDLDLPQDGQLFLLAADGRLGGVAGCRRRQEPPGSGRRREVHPLQSCGQGTESLVQQPSERSS